MTENSWFNSIVFGVGKRYGTIKPKAPCGLKSFGLGIFSILFDIKSCTVKVLLTFRLPRQSVVALSRLFVAKLKVEAIRKF